jgi:hypothetical protein
MSADNSPSGSLTPRWLRVFVALMLALAIGSGLAQGRKKKSPPGPPSDLPGRIGWLAWQLRGLHLDESAAVTEEIQKLVVGDLEQWMADRTPSDVDVRRELERVFAKLRFPTYALPSCFAQPWKGGLLIGAGYSLGWTNYERSNVLALFDNRDGKSRLVLISHFVPGTDLHYEFLSAPGAADMRFIIYGTRLGKSHPRLSAILYSFDGQSLKSLWETHDLYDGKMQVTQDKVIIRYLKEDEFISASVRGENPPRHEVIYKITPQGLTLQTDHQIPF